MLKDMDEGKFFQGKDFQVMHLLFIYFGGRKEHLGIKEIHGHIKNCEWLSLFF